VVGAAQVHGQVADAAFFVLVQRAALAAHGLSAPAEPQPAVLLQRVPQRHRQPAGLVLPGHRHPVGHHHKPAHDASDHGLDSRIAAMTRPTWELVSGKLPQSTPSSYSKYSVSIPWRLRITSIHF